MIPQIACMLCYQSNYYVDCLKPCATLSMHILSIHILIFTTRVVTLGENALLNTQQLGASWSKKLFVSCRFQVVYSSFYSPNEKGENVISVSIKPLNCRPVAYLPIWKL